MKIWGQMGWRSSHTVALCMKFFHLRVPEAYSEPSQTYKMVYFVKTVNSWKPLTIFPKSSILDVWLGSKYSVPLDSFSKRGKIHSFLRICLSLLKKSLNVNLSIYTVQASNQEFLRAGEFSRNEGTSINSLSTTHQRRAPQGKILEFFHLDALKTAFQVRHLTHRWIQSEYFLLKLRYYYSIFKKRQLSPCLTCPLYLRLCSDISFNMSE